MAPVDRREFLGLSLGAAALAGPLASTRARAASRPNLLYVFCDQLRAFSLGFMNADPVRTPNLDRFRQQALHLPNATSSAPVCSPHRGMLFTGRWPHVTGVVSNCNDRSDSHLRPEEICFSDVLDQSGWFCGYIGKLHLEKPTAEDARYGEGPRGDGRVWDAYTPPERRHGFRFWHSYGCCDQHLTPHYWVGDAPISARLDVDGWSVEHETDVAIGFVQNAAGQRPADQPWALFVSHNPPHPPYQQVPERYRERFRDLPVDELLVRGNVRGPAGPRAVADHFAAIEGIDEQFGRLLAALEASGQAENTIVVFTSDHGEMMGSQGRLGKSVIYEESYRVPYLLRWPGHLTRSEDPLHLTSPDIMPTMLGLLGLADAIPEAVQGHDHSDLLLTGAGERPTSSLFRMGPAAPGQGSRGIRTDRYTFLIDFGGDPLVTLFDNQADPYQLDNLAATHEPLCRELLAELNRWLAAIGDPWGQLTWPLRAAGSFAVHPTTDGFHVDFEPDDDAPLQSAPTSPYATLTEAADEVLGGRVSFRMDTTGSPGTYHECLTLRGLLQPGREYELTWRYRVLAADDTTRFYTVIRSTATPTERAARDYWTAPAGSTGTRRLTFATGAIADHHLLCGIQYQGALVIDDLLVRELPGAG